MAERLLLHEQLRTTNRNAEVAYFDGVRKRSGPSPFRVSAARFQRIRTGLSNHLRVLCGEFCKRPLISVYRLVDRP